jgi:hypothetical protein
MPAIAAMASLGGLVSDAVAQAPAVTVVAVPESLALQPDRSASAAIVIRNGTSTAVRDVHLSWFTNSRLEITRPDTVGIALLPPGATLVVHLTIVSHDQAERHGSVILRADFANASTGARNSQFGSLAIAPAGVDAAESILDAQVSASLKTLTEHEPGWLYLILKNKADVSVSVDSLFVSTPSFLRTDSFPRSVSIPPRGISTIPIVIRAQDRVRPGKHQVLLDLALRWPGSGAVRRHLVLSREVDVGVEGESAILAAFGIPSFLVLPGFLIVVTFGALWKRRVLRPDTASTDFPVLKDPEFWLLAITLSGLMAVAYPLLSNGRNYLELYGLRDVALVWMISVFGLGVIPYFLFAAFDSRWQRRRTPKETDDEVTILEKLGRQHLGLLAIPVTVGPTNAAAYALQPMQADRAAIFVGPAIAWEWKGKSTPQDTEKRRQIDKLIAAGDAAGLAKLFQALVETTDVALSFKAPADGTILLPWKVDYKEVKATGSAERIVEKV